MKIGWTEAERRKIGEAVVVARDAGENETDAAAQAAVEQFLGRATGRAEMAARMVDDGGLKKEQTEGLSILVGLALEAESLRAKLAVCEAAFMDAQTDGAMWESEATRLRTTVTELAQGHADAIQRVRDVEFTLTTKMLREVRYRLAAAGCSVSDHSGLLGTLEAIDALAARATDAAQAQRERDAADADFAALAKAASGKARGPVPECRSAGGLVIALWLKDLMEERDAARTESGRLQQARSVAESEVESLRADLVRMTELRDGYRQGGMLEHERAEASEREVEKLQTEKAEAIALAGNATPESDLRGIMRHKLEVIGEFNETISALQAEVERLKAELDRLGTAREALRAEADGLEQRAALSDHWHDLHVHWRERATTAESEVERLRVERDEKALLLNGAKAAKVATVEILGGNADDNLKDSAESVMERLHAAESRLAAIQERVKDRDALHKRAEATWVGVTEWDEACRADVQERGVEDDLHCAAESVAQWVLGGASPQAAAAERLRAENAALDQRWMCAVGDRDALTVRLQDVESRLAALREIILKMRKSPRGADDADPYDRGFGDGWVARGATMRADVDALERGAPTCVIDGKPATDAVPPTLCAECEAEANSPVSPDGSVRGPVGPSQFVHTLRDRGLTRDGWRQRYPNDGDEAGHDNPPAAHRWKYMDLMCATCDQCTLHRRMPSPDAGAGWRCSECSALSTAGRYPCSPTCTHDDASTPGHPERIAALSERMKAFPDVVDSGDAVTRAQDPDPEEEAIAYRNGHMDGAEAMRAAVERWASSCFGSLPLTLRKAMDGI